MNFRSKKKVFFPKFSLAIWFLTLLAVVLALAYKGIDQLNASYAINPSLMADQLNQSRWQIYRLFSSLFLHGSWQHWAGNMLVFLIIALPLEKKIAGF
ncbi:MAG: rhomboid family intramembrane serine protease, partial [Proteobacteria bacterium]|nr:rhomboid family intramembrane serine protease [Pseudomonadota bacterium]